MPENEIKKLRDEINKNNYNYYVLDNPTISDYEYDKLFSRLKELETNHPELITPDSPTQRVGGISSSFSEHKHKYRLYSLDNTYSADELRHWYERIQKEFAGRLSDARRSDSQGSVAKDQAHRQLDGDFDPGLGSREVGNS